MHQAILIASEYPKMSKQGTAGKRKHNFNDSKKFEIIRLKSCESWSMVQAAHNTGLSTIYDIKEQL